MSVLDEKQHRTHLQSHAHNSKALLSQFPSPTVEAYGLKSTFSPVAHPSKWPPLSGYWLKLYDISHISFNSGSFVREPGISICNRNGVCAEVTECLCSWHFHWGLSDHFIIINEITYPTSQLYRPHTVLYSNLLIHTELWYGQPLMEDIIKSQFVLRYVPDFGTIPSQFHKNVSLNILMAVVCLFLSLFSLDLNCLTQVFCLFTSFHWEEYLRYLNQFWPLSNLNLISPLATNFKEVLCSCFLFFSCRFRPHELLLQYGCSDLKSFSKTCEAVFSRIKEL